MVEGYQHKLENLAPRGLEEVLIVHQDIVQTGQVLLVGHTVIIAVHKPGLVVEDTDTEVRITAS